MAIIGTMLLELAAEKLFTELATIITLKKHNAALVSDIEEFKKSLEADLLVVETRRKTLGHDQSYVIESLSKDLEEARVYLERCRNEGLIQRIWNAKTTMSKLTALRKKLAHNFKVKLFFTTLEVVIDEERRTEHFHMKLMELLSLSPTRSDINSTANEIKAMLKPLTSGLKRHEERFQDLRAEIRKLSVSLGSDDNSSSLDTEKFLEDILACLAESVPLNPLNTIEDKTQYLDPFTDELMCDPVKCDDGKTYDRFTVFKYNACAELHVKPLVIHCSDESLRIRLFEKFQDEEPEKKMRSRRIEYRTEALAIANADDFGEAVIRLNNVLQWDPKVSECLDKLDRMRHSYRKEALNLAANGNCEEALNMLQTVQKWSPSDREVFDSLEMIKRQNSATNDRGFQTQPHTSKLQSSSISSGTTLWSYPASAPSAFYSQQRPTSPRASPHYHQRCQGSKTSNHRGPHLDHSATTVVHAVLCTPIKAQQASVPYATTPSLCLSTGKLRIKVFKARDIKGDGWRNMDTLAVGLHLVTIGGNPGGKADPFVVITFGGKNVGGKTQTWVHADGGSNPEWNQAFAFYVKTTDPEYNVLSLAIYNQNIFRKDDFLGSVKIVDMGRYLGENNNQVLEEWYPVLLNGKRRGELLLSFELFPMSTLEIWNSKTSSITSGVDSVSSGSEASTTFRSFR